MAIGKDFIEIAAKAEQDFGLLSIPSNYHVLFTHGGGRGQFAAVPLNYQTLTYQSSLSQRFMDKVAVDVKQIQPRQSGG